MKNWQLQEAKARLSEVVKNALTEGPQRITLRGAPAVVVVSRQEYERLTAPKLPFVEFMRRSPLVGVKLDLRRNKSPVRSTRL